MHLVVGERVFARSEWLARSREGYGAFLLGCVLVDVNHFSKARRRETHFLASEEGPRAFEKSCSRFRSGLDAILVHPWQACSEPERAFVAGYLCHLATDEIWKAHMRSNMQRLGLRSKSDLPVPSRVLATAHSYACGLLYQDYEEVRAALQVAEIPNVLSHVKRKWLRRMWRQVQPYSLNAQRRFAYVEMLAQNGLPEDEAAGMRDEQRRHWKAALAFLDESGSVEPFLVAASTRSRNELSELESPAGSGGAPAQL